MTQAVRPLIVGEDYGHSETRYHIDRYALTGMSGKRLSELSGLTLIEFARRFERTNVVLRPELWEYPLIVSANVAELMERMHERKTLLLGTRVAAAFKSLEVPLFEWTTRWTDVTVARIPHPSGRSRWWNEPANVERARVFMSTLAHENGSHGA